MICTRSSPATNSSCRPFCRRAPFFFNPAHHGRPMNIGAITLPDQSSQSTRINIGILFLLLESKLQHFTLEFYRALTASLRRKEATESQLAESLLNLIEAFSAEAELTACLADRISIDRMDAQHLVLDLSAVARVEEIHFEEVGLNGFWVRVQRTGSNQGLLFGKCGHGKKTNKGADICQVKNAHSHSYHLTSCKFFHIRQDNKNKTKFRHRYRAQIS